MAPRNETGFAGRAGPGPGPPGGGAPGGPPGGPPGGGGGGGAPGGPPKGGPPGGGGPGGAPGAPGAPAGLDFNTAISLFAAFNLASREDICCDIPDKELSTKSGILKTILMIFSIISPN